MAPQAARPTPDHRWRRLLSPAPTDGDKAGRGSGYPLQSRPSHAIPGPLSGRLSLSAFEYVAKLLLLQLGALAATTAAAISQY